MPQDKFGGPHTRQKLETVADYAAFYTTALSGKGFRLKYLDAFAGTGEIPLAGELPLLSGTMDIEKVVVGSSKRALSIARPFDHYYFCELGQRKAAELREALGEFSNLTDRITVWRGDANDAVRQFCADLAPKDRGLVFLDPCGSQVSWATLELLAGTKRVDLWYLFPAGLGVVRQIKNSGEVIESSDASLRRLFRDDGYIAECIASESQLGLFGDIETSRKIATADSITRYMIREMGTIFEGGVADSWLPLGSRGIHKFSLLFACANPGEKAHTLARRVARQIMTRR